MELLWHGNSVAVVVQSLSCVSLFVTHELQHTSVPCPSLSLWVCSNSCPLSQWCHPTISFCHPFSSCPQFSPESGSFTVSWLFTSSGQSIGAPFLPVNVQGWPPLGLTGLISVRSNRLSRVFYSTAIWKHLLLSTEPSWWSNSHPYMTNGKSIALTIWTFVGKVMSLLSNMLSWC